MSGANPSLQKKSAARMAAVQCLYTFSVTGETLDPASQIATLKAQLKNNRDEQKLQTGMALEPNYTLAEALLSGVAEHREDIDARIDASLSKEWKRDRMSPLLLAILQCGLFEMLFYKEISPKIMVDEYTRLTRSFFADAEVNFVHGVLSQFISPRPLGGEG